MIKWKNIKETNAIDYMKICLLLNMFMTATSVIVSSQHNLTQRFVTLQGWGFGEEIPKYVLCVTISARRQEIKFLYMSERQT